MINVMHIQKGVIRSDQNSITLFEYISIASYVMVSSMAVPLDMYLNFDEYIYYPSLCATLPLFLAGVMKWLQSPVSWSSFPPLFFCSAAALSLFQLDRLDFGRGLILFSALIVPFYASQCCRSEVHLRLVIKLFLISSAALLLFMLFEWRGERLGLVVQYGQGRIANPNAFGVQMAIACVILVAHYIMRTESSWHNYGLNYSDYLLQFVALLFFTAVLLSGSRGAAIAVFGTFALMFIVSRLSPARIVCCLICLFLGFLLFVIDEGPLAELTERFRDTETVGSFGDRLPIWQASLEIFKEEYLFGVGIGGVESKIGDAMIVSDHGVRTDDNGVNRRAAHNTYLELSLSTGVPGIIAAIIFFVYSALVYIAYDKQDGSNIRVLLLTCVSLSALTTTIYRLDIWYSVSLIMYILLADNKCNSFMRNRRQFHQAVFMNNLCVK